jgi:hypothetical protein
MGKAAPNSTLDALLAEIATATRLVVTSAEPADFAGIAAVALADIALTAGDGNGDFTIADGDTSGRKVTVAQQADVDIDTTGDATHVCLDDGTDLIYVTTCTLQTLTSGGTVTVPAWKIEIADPA